MTKDDLILLVFLLIFITFASYGLYAQKYNDQHSPTEEDDQSSDDKT